MTAEIGILNTTGVALAADSAVTVGSSKVFNTADKLFSLSKHHPVGVMFYGNASFMGVPWETVIKIYRKRLGALTFPTLEEYCDDFFEFLKEDSRFYDKEYERKLIATKFNQFFEELLDNINDTIPEIWKVDPTEEQILQIIFGESSYFAGYLTDMDTVEGFNDDYFEYFYDNYGDTVEKIITSKVNLDVDEEIIYLFIIIAACLVIKEEFYLNDTGVVIAGFGDDEIFPVLKSYTVEGIFNGVLKYKEGHDVHINANKSATIVPFAQQEMVHSFLTGIDPYLKRQVVGLIEKITLIYPKVVEKNASSWDEEQNELLKNFGEEIFEQFTSRIDELINDEFSSPILNTVATFPKEELAAMAEALVNLTSIKRKVSFQTETVGGPIDVAVISKGDGFIWIKRKHYFNADLNHSYFTNYMER